MLYSNLLKCVHIKFRLQRAVKMWLSKRIRL